MQTLSHRSPRPLLASLLLLLAASRAPSAEAKVASIEIPCVEFSSAISVPCLCSLNEVNATRINCDNVVFPGDFPVLPLRYYIQEFSQQGAGWQQLPAQIFTASDIPLKIVDFSHNSMRRLAVRQVLFTSFYIDTNIDTVMNIQYLEKVSLLKLLSHFKINLGSFNKLFSQ